MGIIESAREKKRWSRQELADALGVTRQAVFNWEKKKVTPSLIIMERISKLLGVSKSKIVNDYF